MRTWFVSVSILIILAIAATGPLHGQRRGKKQMPGLSGFFDFREATSELTAVLGNASRRSCMVGTATQPAIYDGNMLVDCDGEVPHNETTIAVNPNNPNHAVGGYHSYQLVRVGRRVHQHVFGTVSVTLNGGADWQEVVPSSLPFQFTGDPALAFNANGRIYFANIADHEGPSGNFTGPSVVATFSDDGGFTWAPQQIVARGQGGIDARGNGVEIFQDKSFLTADSSASSPYQNRVYVTWTSFQTKFSSGFSPILFRFPIMTAYSDDVLNWSSPK